MPLALFALGLLSIFVLVGTDRLRQEVLVRDLAQMTAVNEIQVAMAISHLWLEEYVTGDSVDEDEIFANLDRAQRRVQRLLGESGSADSEDDELRLEALEDRDQRLEASALRNWIEQFREISIERHAGFSEGRDVGIGSPIDVEYDRVFGRALDAARKLHADLGMHLQRSQRRSATVFWSIVMAWSLIVVVAILGLWTRERQRRRAEEALRASQEQLFHSQKMEAVGRLAGGLAHDINNYLAAIRGHCELVHMKRPEGDRIGKKMEAAIRIIGKASSLIERLQNVRQDRPLQLDVINLNRIVAGLGKMMAPSLGEGVELDIRLQEGLWNVRIDPGQLEQLIVNLMVNASDAMPDGGTLIVETANAHRSLPSLGPNREDPDGEWVLLTVADTGVGIPLEIRDRIFEPFLTTKDESDRRGLGLSIVYGVTKQHGGHLELNSTVGKGTAFRIYFPRCAEEETSAEVIARHRPQQLRGTEGILLVDDNPDFRESTASLLEALGYKVFTAVDGHDALHRFETSGDEIELVLTDIVMPEISGFELIDQLRQRRPVKAIFMSGYDDSVMAGRGLEPGLDRFLKKLFSAGELANTVRSMLEEPDPATEAAS